MVQLEQNLSLTLKNLAGFGAVVSAEQQVRFLCTWAKALDWSKEEGRGVLCHCVICSCPETLVLAL